VGCRSEDAIVKLSKGVEKTFFKLHSDSLILTLTQSSTPLLYRCQGGNCVQCTPYADLIKREYSKVACYRREQDAFEPS
jgi:ferredoxin